MLRLLVLLGSLGAALSGTAFAGPGGDQGGLNRRLRAALDDPESRAVPELIRQGADVRTRGQDGYTALMWAISHQDHDLTRDLLQRGADPTAEVPRLPQRGGASTAYALEELEQGLSETLKKHGRTSRLLLGLGDVRFRLGRYRQSELAFQAAVGMGSTGAAPGLTRAREYRQALAAIRPSLPRPHHEVRLARLRGSSGTLWAVVSARKHEPGAVTGSPLSQPELRAFVSSGGKLRQSGATQSVADPRWAATDEFSRLTLYFGDLARSAGDEVAVETLVAGASWAPTHLSMFTIRNERLVRVLKVTSSEPLWMEDLDRDRSVEVGNYYEIGDTLSHAEQPRWTDIYSYRSGQYELANTRFSTEFQRWPRRLAELLKRNPDDAELAFFLGQAHDVLKQPSRARAGYYQAVALYQQRLKSETDPELRAAYEARRVRAQRRIRALNSGL